MPEHLQLSGGPQTVSETVTFSTSPTVPTPTTSTQASNKSYVDTAIAGTVTTAEVGAPNGIAPLDGSSKVPTANLPSSVVGALNYQGTFDASTGSYPTSPQKGYYYIASVAGTVSGTAYKVGDWATYDGTSWDKIDNSTIGTNSVANSNLAQAPANTLKGNNTGSTGNVQDLTVAQVKTMLAIAEGDVTGLVSDLAAKAALASPAFTGTPTAPTATLGTNTTQIATTAFVNATAAADTPEATTTSLGTIQLAGDLSNSTAATSPVTNSRTAKATVGNTVADFVINSTTDASTTITNAIASLTAGRTWVETVYLRGNFTVNNFTTIPSYTRVVLDGIINTTTLRPSGTTNWTDNMGVFEIGSRSTYAVTTQASVEFTQGSKVIGDYFNTNASSYPQDKTNVAYATDPTIQYQKNVDVIHSYNTLIGCNFINVFGENMHDIVHLETLGRTNGTPSKSNRIIGTRGRYVICVVECYVNGYESDSLYVGDTYGNYSLDDIVAIVGSGGGTTGANGIMYDVTVDGVWGAKNGLRGSGVKLDGGTTTSGTGQLTNINIANVNLMSTSATLSGVLANECVTYITNGSNPATRNINYTNLKGAGNWQFGIRGQVSGVDLHFTNVYAEALYGAIFTSSIVPTAVQKLTITDTTFVERNTTSGETGSLGIGFNGGSSVQGYQNITLRNVKTHYFATPISDALTISGIGTAGTIQNVDYEIDIMGSTLGSMVTTATNRRVNVKQYGQIVQQDNGGVSLLNVAAPVNSTDAANKTYVDSSISTNTNSNVIPLIIALG